MSHCPANPRFHFIHEERATGSHYVCALCGARRLRDWAPEAGWRPIETAADGLVKQLKKEITIEMATLAATTAGGTQWPN